MTHAYQLTVTGCVYSTYSLFLFCPLEKVKVSTTNTISAVRVSARQVGERSTIRPVPRASFLPFLSTTFHQRVHRQVNDLSPYMAGSKPPGGSRARPICRISVASFRCHHFGGFGASPTASRKCSRESEIFPLPSFAAITRFSWLIFLFSPFLHFLWRFLALAFVHVRLRMCLMCVRAPADDKQKSLRVLHLPSCVSCLASTAPPPSHHSYGCTSHTTTLELVPRTTLPPPPLP
ncbi:hypothetical protein EJ06DRAFT_224751 [Trichodelitschia bisporula]|uniref:Uncharacterized protein n=1 Tax=Trichodelitschia bisporula TaxID=703511 RepID=A0A6G1HKH2_9PEZI|nr:hypothetical protein EJ06DRAFT_224751 [Trichodelitschia bisporula]